MKLSIPQALNSEKFNDKQLYVIGILTITKVEGKYKYKKVSKDNLVKVLGKDYMHIFQYLVDVTLIKIISEDTQFLTYDFDFGFDINYTKQVHLNIDIPKVENKTLSKLTSIVFPQRIIGEDFNSIEELIKRYKQVYMRLYNLQKDVDKKVDQIQSYQNQLDKYKSKCGKLDDDNNSTTSIDSIQFLDESTPKDKKYDHEYDQKMRELIRENRELKRKLKSQSSNEDIDDDDRMVNTFVNYLFNDH